MSFTAGVIFPPPAGAKEQQNRPQNEYFFYYTWIISHNQKKGVNYGQNVLSDPSRNAAPDDHIP